LDFSVPVPDGHEENSTQVPDAIDPTVNRDDLPFKSRGDFSARMGSFKQSAPP
jgi:hypothetical protein